MGGLSCLLAVWLLLALPWLAASEKSMGSPRVVGGTDSQNGSWPWQVSIRQYGSHVCGGSLIGESWVVSAAHCFNQSTSDYEVNLGEYQLLNPSESLVSLPIKQIYRYPSYTEIGSSGDIALVELETPVNFNSVIRPVYLPASSVEFPAGMECWVTGWGNTQYEESLTAPKTLQELQVPLIDRDTCNEYFNTGSYPDDPQESDPIKLDMICAGYPEGEKDACQGDSGGPLVCECEGTWLLAGVVSWGVECALPNRPGVYTLLPPYTSWIQGYAPIVPSTPVCAPASQNQSGCGKQLISGRIFNGQDAKDGAWPWQVSVQRNGSHICGGSLISESWVVSAAHCFDPSVTNSAYRMQLGEKRIGNETSTQPFSSVKRIIRHPNYNSSTFLADIALVELKTPIAFTATISPVCLLDASVRVPAGDTCWVTGWGNILPQAVYYPAETLQELEVFTVDSTICNSLFREALKWPVGSNPIKEDMVCAGPAEGYKGFAPGDSGGPLVCEEDGTWYLAGIVSLLLMGNVNGEFSILPGYPGVYNRPNAYNNWTQENVPGVTFKVVNFTLNRASPPTTVTPSSVRPSTTATLNNACLSTTITWNGAGPSATVLKVLLLAVFLWLTL